MDEKCKSFYDVGDVITSPVSRVKSALDEESVLRERGLPTPLTPYMSDESIGLAQLASDFVPSSGEELAEELALNTAFSINWGNKTVRAANNILDYLKAKKANEVGIAEAEEWSKDLNPLELIEAFKFDAEFGPEKVGRKAKETLEWAGEEADAQIATVYADHDFLSSHFPSYTLVNEDPTKYMGPDSEQFFRSYGAPLVREVRDQLELARYIEENPELYIDQSSLGGLEDTIDLTKQTLYDAFNELYTDDQVMEYLDVVSGANKSIPDKIYKGVDMTAARRVGLISE